MTPRVRRELKCRQMWDSAAEAQLPEVVSTHHIKELGSWWLGLTWQEGSLHWESAGKSTVQSYRTVENLREMQRNLGIYLDSKSPRRKRGTKILISYA